MSSYYVLKITYASKQTETRNISEPSTSMGRESGDIVLADPQSSGRHAEIVFENGQVRVKDLGSTNGTWFNGQRSTEFPLQPGEYFQIGHGTFQLLAVHTPQAAAPAGGGEKKTMIAFGGAPPPAAPPRPGAGPAAGPPPAGAAWGAPPPAAQPAAPAPAPVAPPPAAAPAPAPMAPPPGMAPAPAPAQPQPSAYPGAPSLAAPVPASTGGGAPPMNPPPGNPAAPAPGNPYTPAPAPAAAPAVAGGPYVPQAAVGSPGGIRPVFQAGGAELLVFFIIHGWLLMMVTLGIYMPWFICKLQGVVASRTTLQGTARGPLQLSFHGTGGSLFILGLKFFLVPLTLGIYLPWWICGLIRFFTDNHVATASDGTQYRLRFRGTGGQLFVAIFVQALLTMITFGLYGPWALCKIWQSLARSTQVEENGQPVGNMDFQGSGGELFVQYLLAMVLMPLTLGIYQFWFQVKLQKFMNRGLRVGVHGRTFQGDYHGKGGEWFVLNLVGFLLSMLTLGIYFPWFIVKLIKYQYDHTVFGEMGAAGQQQAFQPRQPAVG